MALRLLRLVGINLARMVALLFCVCAAAFVLLSVSPVDPLQANIGQAALGSMSAEQIERLRQYWGVDKPAAERFAAWIFDFLRGDMGISLLYRREVSQVIAEKLANSLGMMALSWTISGVVGLAMGIAAGANRGKKLDRAVRAYSLFIAGTPSFWLALLLLMIFSVYLGWLPIGLSVPIGVDHLDVTFLDRVRHAILPAMTLSMTGVSTIALHTREKMAVVMESDYILYARARGESKSTMIKRHGLRNVLLPAITIQCASVSEILGGSVLVEQVFSYPGLGQAAVTAGLGGDVPLLLGITVVSAFIVFLGNMTANILYGVVDPRIRRGAGG